MRRALTFEACDAEQLATLLCSTLRDRALRAALAERGLARVRAFTWEGVARKALQAYAALKVTAGGKS